MRLIDFSSEIYPGMPKPPSAPEVTMRYTISQSAETEAQKGFSNKLEEYTITTHVATHFDAPSHFTTKGKNIDEFSLDRFFMVPSLMLKVTKGEYGEISVKDLEDAQKEAGEIRKGDLVYLNTGFFRLYGEDAYLKTPYLSEEAARYLADAEVSMGRVRCVYQAGGSFRGRRSGMKRVIRLSEKDNVAVVLCDLEEGEFLEEIGIRAKEAIPYGHKIALADIRPGEKITKYGEAVGNCIGEIAKGGWVHVHNVESIRGLGR